MEGVEGLLQFIKVRNFCGRFFLGSYGFAGFIPLKGSQLLLFCYRLL